MVDSISVADHPTIIIGDDNYAYVFSYRSDLCIIDLDEMQVVETIQLEEGPEDGVVSSDGFIYFSNDYGIIKVDPRNLSSEKVVSMVSEESQITVNNDGSVLFAAFCEAYESAWDLYVYDTASWNQIHVATNLTEGQARDGLIDDLIVTRARVNLGEEIELLEPLGIKIAVISNASLMWREDVRKDLMAADWVSLKVDAATEGLWRRVNRPHRKLKHEVVLEGMREFSDVYNGELATETMLVDGLNDDSEEVEKIAGFLRDLKPDKAYIAIPTRPPAESARAREHPQHYSDSRVVKAVKDSSIE